MKKTILLIIIVLYIGYFFKEQIFFIDIYNKYFVIDYFTLSIYITELIALIFIIYFISKKIINKKTK